MTWRLVSEKEFSCRIKKVLLDKDFPKVRCVTGPGRSGAICAVYASHLLRIPFIPHHGKLTIPNHLQPVLVIDTATESGKTLRKASRKTGVNTIAVALYDEPPRVKFWYEETNPKPQQFKKD